MSTILVTETIAWFEHVATDTILNISCTIPGGLPDKKGAALFAFEFAGEVADADLEGTGLSMSKTLGMPYRYLEGESGDTSFATTIRLPRLRLRRIGLRLWNHKTPFEIADLRLASSSAHDPFFVSVTVNVEALLGRAPADHVHRLIFGRFGATEHGIRAQMQLFRENNVPATFLLECGQVAPHGFEPVATAARAILDEGFDLQLHLHPELLVRSQNWPWPGDDFPDLHNLDRPQTRRAMTYAVEQFRAMTGSNPKIFRAGSFQFNPYSIEVGRELGVSAFTNYRADYPENNGYDFLKDRPVRPFRWTNGLYEFPITISPEPLSEWSPESVWERILYHVDINKTWLVTIVIHSWSFLVRTEEGYQEWRGSGLADALRSIIALAPPQATFVSQGDVLAAIESGKIPVELRRDAGDLVRRNPDGSIGPT